MNQEPPPRPSTWAYALVAAAIWAMAAYDLLVHKPQPAWSAAAFRQACAG